ncbi:MAG: hypothetical protein IPJ51_21325 [Saprospiraceae bacterium]|nr:hypothetical protein [Saprospiraceae bacterium]
MKVTIRATCRTERSRRVKYDSASSEGTRQWQDGRVNEALSKLTWSQFMEQTTNSTHHPRSKLFCCHGKSRYKVNDSGRMTLSHPTA